MDEDGAYAGGAQARHLRLRLSRVRRVPHRSRPAACPQRLRLPAERQAAPAGADGVPSTDRRPVVKWLHPADHEFPAAGARAVNVSGCPPRPALCRFHHVFNEVLLVTLPRRRAKWLRLTQQLTKHGIAHTLVHAVDGRGSRAFANSFAQTGGKNGWSLPWKPTELALLSVQVDILDYLLRSPFDNVLVLEDDAILMNDDRFAAEFDRQMRLVRPDWTQLFLGATIDTWTDGVILQDGPAFRAMDASGDHAPFPVKTIYGTFAVAWRRSVAEEILREHTNMKLPLDNTGLHVVAQRYPGRTLVFWPFLIVPDVRTTDMQTMDQAKQESYSRCRWDWPKYNMTPADASPAAAPLSVLVGSWLVDAGGGGGAAGRRALRAAGAGGAGEVLLDRIAE